MLNAIRLVQETVESLRSQKKFTGGELSMLLDIYNSTMLAPGALDRSALDLQVRDSFDLYPGVYEEKWKTEKKELLDKIAALTDWQAACLQIWAVDFWQSGCCEGPSAIADYITGKTSAGHRLIEAYRTAQDARELCERFKGTGVKSKLIAQAQEKCRQAAAILEQLID